MGGAVPVEDLPRTAVQLRLDNGDVVGAVDRQVRPLGEVGAQQAVGVLVGGALPGRVRVAEVDLHRAEARGDLGVTGHLAALVPGECPPQVGR